MKVTIHDLAGFHVASLQYVAAKDESLYRKAEYIKAILRLLKNSSTEERYEVLTSCLIGCHAVANGAVQIVSPPVQSPDGTESKS